MTGDFEPLSCPMCGGELIYSEGTHDLCCVKNASEFSSREMGRGRIGETTGDRGERFSAMPGDKFGDRGERFSAMPGDKLEDRGERFSAMPGDKLENRDRALHEPRTGYGNLDGKDGTSGELGAQQRTEQETEKSKTTRTNYSSLAEEAHVGVNEYLMSKRDMEKSRGARTKGPGFAEETSIELRIPRIHDNVTEKPKSTRTCVFALSFTESANYGTLWSIRTVHGGTNYFALMRLMDKIEKRQKRGEPLAANVPNLPRKVERSKGCKLAFRYNLEVEDLYSIKYSSETVNKLAMYYGLTEPDIRHIQAVEIGEE